MRRLAIPLVAVAMITAACNEDLGVRHPACDGRSANATHVLYAQAVPTARYTPCIDKLKLGWDEVAVEMEDGKAGFSLSRNFTAFFSATVTKTCDVGDAERVPTGFEDIERYEDIDAEIAELRLTIIPTADRPLVRANTLARQFDGFEIEDRLLAVTVDDDIEQPVSSRVNRALLTDRFVWIIGELDVEENTLELRQGRQSQGARGISVDDALDLMEETIPDVHYRGHWYFTFEGGCITYEFDTKGVLAETIAADADESFGFFPAYLLWESARRAGYEIGPPPGDE
jgi:hypothetical protein